MKIENSQLSSLKEVILVDNTPVTNARNFKWKNGGVDVSES
jgi:hypothetical protein